MEVDVGLSTDRFQEESKWGAGMGVGMKDETRGNAGGNALKGI